MMYSVYIPRAGSSDSKEYACNTGDVGWIADLGRSPGEGNVNPLQYSCLENPMGRGAWRATVLGVAKSQTQLNLARISFLLVQILQSFPALLTY